MKVQVNMMTSSNSATSKFDLTLKADDLVKDVKEKIAASQLIAFPEQELSFDGKIMDGSKTMSDYGVKEYDSLDFVILTSEENLLKQMSELLKARDLTADELGLLYCYKHGVSINQALKTIGIDMKLEEFVKNSKSLIFEKGRVSLVRDDTSLKPFSAADELEKLLKNEGSTMDITALCSKFVQKFNVSVASIVGMRPVDFLEEESNFVVHGKGMVSLKEAYDLISKPNSMRTEGERVRSRSRSPAPAALGRQKRSVSPDDWRRKSPERTDTKNDQMYQDLHNKISGRAFNSRAAQTLTSAIDLIEKSSVLNIASVMKGGSIGKGTAITGCSDAEVVFFLKGLPTSSHGKWLPPLLKMVHSDLEKLPGKQISDLSVSKDTLSMTVNNLVNLKVRFSPYFESYADVISALGAQGPGARKAFEPAFVKESSNFVSKQPGQVKISIRLLKWWRDQTWSCDLTRPSDYLLELMAIYSAQQTKPKDQSVAIANLMSLLARFDQIRIVWNNFYRKSDIWAPLLLQKPLLMDPVNPFVNVADPQDFDPRELMALASQTHFFW